MNKQFHQTVWDDRLARDWAALLRLAIDEDLGTSGDWTSNAVVPEEAVGRADVVARQHGIVAGLAAARQTIEPFDRRLKWISSTEDGSAVAPGQSVGTIEGPLRGMLAAERVLLNLIGRLSGIATLTSRYVEAVSGTSARLYDTRKTTPGWRRLEKYAVRCGGGWNHRGGLNEAVLIKDNHLAIGQVDVHRGLSQFSLRGECCDEKNGCRGENGTVPFGPAEAVQRAREFILKHADADMPIEIEVDSLEQLDAVLTARPDIVLLDNMNPAQLREAVARRNAAAPDVELEASGGVNLNTIRAIAESGVERISVGALTHSAVSLDFGLDWTGM